jgi:tRNA G37 N-methylase Trm5
MFAVRVKCRDAEKVRKHLIKEGLFDNKRRIVRKNNFVEIPVVAKSPEYEVIEQKNPVFAKNA